MKRIILTIALLMIAQAASAQWSYRSSQDKMRDVKTLHAKLNSINKVTLGFPYSGGSTLVLALRDNPNEGEDALISIDRGIFGCSSDCEIVAKFDNEEVKDWVVIGSEGGNNNTYFISDSSRAKFIEKLKSSETLTIEVLLFNHGREQFKFKTKGLKWNRTPPASVPPST